MCSIDLSSVKQSLINMSVKLMSLIGVTIISSQMDGVAKLSADTPAVLKKISALETENKTFKKGMYVCIYNTYVCIYNT